MIVRPFLTAMTLALIATPADAETHEDRAVIRAALAATGRAKCTAPRRSPGLFAVSAAEHARDDRGGRLTAWYKLYFRVWWQPAGSGKVDEPIAERLASALARLLASLAGKVTRADIPDLDRPGPCDGLAVGAVETMDGIAFVEVSERRGARDGNGTLWAFEQRGDAWVPLGQKTTWIM